MASNNEKAQHLVHNRVKDFTAQKVSRNGKLSIDQANPRVIRVFHIETSEIELGICKKMSFLNGQRRKTATTRTIIDFTSVRELVRFAERMHKIGQTCGIEMRWMFGK